MEVQAIGGVCRTHDLIQADMTTPAIAHAVRAGDLRRLRRGWYAARDADDRAVRAVTAGGALGCASALAFHGAWDVTGKVVHVRTDHNRSTGLGPGLKHCHAYGDLDDLAPRKAVDDLDVALRCAWRCLPEEEFLMVCDSLLHRRLMSLDEITSAVRPARGRDACLDKCDQAESGTETLVRLRLRALGIRIQAQVVIPGVGRVDLLVGERLVIEVDSVAHHTGVEHYRSDRLRDLHLRSLGYIVVRLTYHQVMTDWPATEQALLNMIRRGDHRAPRATRPDSRGPAAMDRSKTLIRV